MSASHSGTPLVRKLGIREGHRVSCLGAPDHLPALLVGLPDSVRVEVDPSVPDTFDGSEARSRDVVLLFCPDRSALDDGFPGSHRLLAWDGGLWVCWPKKSSPLASDVDRSVVQRHGLDAGLVDNKVCAVDEDWSGMRFVYRIEDRPSQQT